MLRPRAWNMVEHNMMLGLPAGCIKATVLIECVPASFEMEILYELKEHSAGLNCGIWDYSASFVNRFGVDGFMVYDMDLIEPMQKLFQLHSHGQNQLLQLREDITVTPEDLLIMPAGGVTLYGLRYNIAVGVLFIEAWLSGRGHFFYLGKVWQWIRHQVRLEDDRAVVTRALVSSLAEVLMEDLKAAIHCQTSRDKQRLMTAVSMFLETVLKNDFPEFLTTYLNLDHTFHSSQS
ncbi:hypothetical protein cypCar_00019932 [Cyprinus carpio]|nr:hypothetical protein cypCar_00019932 [Cyprinus carpio]